jgi:hypothetical protein
MMHSDWRVSPRRAADYESGGQEFESLRGRQYLAHIQHDKRKGGDGWGTAAASVPQSTALMPLFETIVCRFDTFRIRAVLPPSERSQLPRVSPRRWCGYDASIYGGLLSGSL